MKQILLAVCVLLAGLAITAFGQEITGSIVGTVKDASGAGVPGATVTVTNTDRNAVVRTETTDSHGDFSATLLDVGHYSVSAEAKGFKKVTVKDIQLNVSDKLTINLPLEIGDVQQEVTVESAPTQVTLQSAEQSTVINGTQIRELALITRNYEQLVSLMPGVSAASVDQLYVGTSLPSGVVATIPFSINGARNSASSWLVDGADNIDRGSNLTLLTTPSIDAIEEFKVLRSNYGADLGRAGGGIISVITKSGTNQFHGDLYEFVRNNDFAANNFYNNATSQNLGTDGKAQVAPLHYNNFGWTLGGPVLIPGLYDPRKMDKHQTYFFVSEEFRRVITYASGTAIVPTSSELTGVFPTPVCVQFAGSACAQTATTISNIDPVAKEYIADIFSRVGLPSNTNTLVNLFRNVYNFEQEIYKLDHNFSQKLQLSARFQRDQIPTIEPTGLFSLGETIPNVGNTSTNAPGRTWVVRGTSTFTPTWLNEIGWNYSYGAIISNPTGFINSTSSPDIKSALPFPVTLGRVPSLSFLGGTGITGYGPYRDYNRNHNIYDNMTKVLGRHTIKFGGTYNHYEKKENNASANAGSFAFTPASEPAGTTAFNQAFANFLLGNVASFSQASEDVTPDIHANQYELYVQDDFRVKPNFTLNLGVRYSNFRQPTDSNHELTNFDPALFNRANVPALTPSGLLANVSANSYLNGIIINGQNSPFGQKVGSQDNTDFAPRFGFAWDPFGDGKTSIRGGYGMFYDSTLYGTYEQNIFANPPFVNTVTINNVTLDNPAGGTANVATSPKNLVATPTNFKTPYLQQWSFEVQRDIFRNTIINMAYVGSKGTHLLGTLDLNELPPGLAYSSGLIAPNTPITSANTPSLNILRPYVGYAAFSQAIEPWFNSNYNSLQISGQKRFSSDVLSTFAYTWSHALTDNQSDRSNAAQNTYNFNRGEYGPSLYDRTQVFSLNFVYTLPFFKTQKGVVGKVLGGWEVSALANYYTGLPYTATTSGTDPAGLGIIGASGASLRPNLVCDPNSGFTFSRFEGFNTACFPNPTVAAHLPGNEGRGVIRGPGYEGWSTAASKNLLFGPGERFRFQLRGEASNVLNHTNPSTFGSLSNVSSLFGQITGYRDPRIIQLGAKLYF
jgi:carboxypeptidase family protein/TonB-dependent receptor-like protein